jgi:radical SAM protein with 4Fe4S-binding SPASM domain
MYDINFYMKSYPIIKQLENGDNIPKKEMLKMFESFRSEDPIIYNIETTNACNMRCKMCPRTTKMDRKITFLDQEYYENIINQIKPHDKKLWNEWEKFCTKNYGIAPNDKPSENHFFLYIISKVIQLHGYGDPLLDKNLGNVVKLLSDSGFESYFSCNPANIDVGRTEEMMEKGLTYLKYSFESTDDIKFKDIRGNAANFTEAYKKTLEVLSIKKKKGLNTNIIITMIDVGHDEEQQQEFEKLSKVFKDNDVYIYLKSEDQQWYRKDESLKSYLEVRGREVPEQEQDFYGTNAIHWQEFCKHPWMSMSVKSDGEIHMCMEDYNNEIFLGDSNKSSLRDIWNGDLYNKFRNDHFELTPCIKCTEECDMPKIGQLIY